MHKENYINIITFSSVLVAGEVFLLRTNKIPFKLDLEVSKLFQVGLQSFKSPQTAITKHKREREYSNERSGGECRWRRRRGDRTVEGVPGQQITCCLGLI